MTNFFSSTIDLKYEKLIFIKKNLIESRNTLGIQGLEHVGRCLEKMPSCSGWDDQRLVEECLSGSKMAWDEFYVRFELLIRKAISTHMSGIRLTDTQDIFQSVFVTLCTALKNYDPRFPLSKFVWTVACRVCVDEYRMSMAAKRDAKMIPVDQSPEGLPGMILKSNEVSQEEQFVMAEAAHNLKSAFNSLSEKCRELIQLRYFRELSFKEISAVLGIKEKTLVVQAGRCLDNLRLNYASLEEGAIK